MKQALDADLFADCFAAQHELLSMFVMHAIVVSVGDIASLYTVNGTRRGSGRTCAHICVCYRLCSPRNVAD